MSIFRNTVGPASVMTTAPFRGRFRIRRSGALNLVDQDLSDALAWYPKQKV
jgi:hypothetical protein